MKHRQKNHDMNENIAPSIQSELATRICWYHFREGQTQQEVADRVGLSRVTINKIISDAFRRGYVKIFFDTPSGACLDLEGQLRKKYGLRDVVVVPSPLDASTVRSIVGLATGEYVSKNLKPNQVLSLGWGGTIHAAAQSLEPRVDSGNVVVSLSGGLSRSTVINPYDNAAVFARILDAECYYMTAPMFADSKSMKNALINSQGIQAVFEVAKKADMALLTAVDLTNKTWIIKEGALSKEMLRSLVAAGAVGGVCDRYLNSNGEVVDHSLNDLAISVPFETIRRTPNVILASGGDFKVPIIRAIFKAKLIHAFITDETTAKMLIADAGSQNRR